MMWYIYIYHLRWFSLRHPIKNSPYRLFYSGKRFLSKLGMNGQKKEWVGSRWNVPRVPAWISSTSTISFHETAVCVAFSSKHNQTVRENWLGIDESVFFWEDCDLEERSDRKGYTKIEQQEGAKPLQIGQFLNLLYWETRPADDEYSITLKRGEVR